MTEEIIAMVKQLGCVSDGQEAVLDVLCQAAEREMTGRLRTGVGPQDCGPAFVLGCAWLVLAWLSAGTDGTVSSFTAGDLSIQEISGSEASQRAAVLRLQAETVLRPYLEDQGFTFQGVRG